MMETTNIAHVNNRSLSINQLLNHSFIDDVTPSSQLNLLENFEELGGGGGEEKYPPQSQASEISVVCDKVDGAVRNRIQKSELSSVHLDSSRQTGFQSNNKKYFSIFNSCRPDITKVKKRSREE